MLEEVDLFRDFWVMVERDKGLLKLRVTDFASGKGHYIDFDEAVYTAHPGVNDEFDTRQFRFLFESLVTPTLLVRLRRGDAQTRKLLKRKPVLGGYDPEQYTSEALTAVADGRHAHARSRSSTGSPSSATGPSRCCSTATAPTASPWIRTFRSSRISLLDRGMIYAIAHIRGGGDRGRTWYDDGKLMKKKNTFTDFVAVADSLVRRKLTAPDRLVIQGGSAGGLLMGAVTNLRPELFKAVVTAGALRGRDEHDARSRRCRSRFREYLEWGNPNEAKAYKYMRSYSPYDNLKKGAYPAILVETSLNDSQVMYWEPAKYVAKVRTLKTDSNPLHPQDHHGGGPRRRLGPLRRAQGAVLHLQLHPRPGWPRQLKSARAPTSFP